MVRAGQLDDYLMSPLVYTVAARTALYRGGRPQAREHLARAARLRPLLTYAIPWGAVQTLLEMARAYLLLDDTAGARAVVRQAHDLLRVRPDLGVLPAQTEELHAKLDTTRGRFIGASTLTTAELRLLPLLPTHLSFKEIGDRLYVSKHTAKTRAVSIYRKLGVSSRSEAINRLQETWPARGASPPRRPFPAVGMMHLTGGRVSWVMTLQARSDPNLRGEYRGRPIRGEGPNRVAPAGRIS